MVKKIAFCILVDFTYPFNIVNVWQIDLIFVVNLCNETQKWSWMAKNVFRYLCNVFWRKKGQKSGNCINLDKHLKYKARKWNLLFCETPSSLFGTNKLQWSKSKKSLFSENSNFVSRCRRTYLLSSFKWGQLCKNLKLTVFTSDSVAKQENVRTEAHSVGNLCRILLSSRFYLKSILENVKVQKMPFLQF